VHKQELIEGYPWP